MKVAVAMTKMMVIIKTMIMITIMMAAACL